MRKKTLFSTLLGGMAAAAVIAATSTAVPAVGSAGAVASGGETADVPEATVPQRQSVQSPKSVAMTAESLYGEWILTYTSAVSSRPYPGGHSLKITPIAGTDSVQLSQWYFTDLGGPKGKVDMENGKIFIPTQYIGKGVSGTETVDIWFAPRLSTGGANWTAGSGVTLTLGADGNFSIDTSYGWGLFIYNTNSGYQWTNAAGAGSLLKPNGVMKYAKNSAPADTITTPVYMKQNGGSVMVTNFYNVGRTVEFILKSDSTINVPEQVAFQNSTAPYYLVNITKYDAAAGTVTYAKTFNTLPAPEENMIYLPPWSLFGTTTAGSSSWFGLYDWASIKGDISFVYPIETGLTGSGTSTDPYQIASVDDWNKFAAYTTLSSGEGQYFKITADIDFTGAEFKMACEQPFKGTLQGNGKTLKGITITTDQDTVGVMRRIDKGAVVEKLNLIGSLTTSGHCAGLLAGKAEGVSFTSITTGTTSTHSTITSTYAIKAVSDFISTGGVVGYAGNGCTFYSVRNYADITTQGGGVGGLIGSGGQGLSFTSSYNYGKINVTSPTYKSQCVGGFAGFLHPSTFTNCYNRATITGDTNTEWVAGLVGQAQSGSGDTGDFLFKTCNNNVAITGLGYLGGIIGSNSVGGTSTSKCVFEDCSNDAGGVIKSTATANNGSPLGGIAAYIVKGATLKNCSNAAAITGFNQNSAGIAGKTAAATEDMPIVITGCTNTGKVSTQTYYAGGITATISAFVNVNSCLNTGDVEGLYGVGGIAGYVASVTGVKPSYITDCINTGNVTCSTNRTGGIVGNSQSSQIVITGCVNGGNVTSLCENGGTQATQTTSANVSGFAIGGIAGIANSTLKNCVNTGSVKGASRVGGIIGQPTKANASVTGCINVGAIIAPADTCGPVIGVNTTNTAIWTTGNDVVSTFYTNGVAEAYSVPAYANTLGTSLPLAQIAGKTMEGMYAPDTYSLPIPETLKDNPVAILYSATVVPEGAQTYAAITSDFHIGAPKGVTWTASIPNISFRDNIGKFVTSYKGDIKLTLKSGTYTRTIDIKADATGSGIGLKGEGTVANPYLISSLADWNNLCDYSAVDNCAGLNFKVTSDIDFTGSTVYSVGKVLRFQGNFNGDNHTFKGLDAVTSTSHSAALFQTIDTVACVSNLTIEGKMTYGGTYNGAFVAALYGRLENIISRMDITTASTYSGGIVGRAYDGAVMKGLVNKGTMTTSAGYMAGIAGYCGSVTFDSCGNEATMVNTVATTNVSGIVPTSSRPSKFHNCWNAGDWSKINPATASVAGMAGLTPGPASDPADYEFINCVNRADLTGASNVCGLIGSSGALQTGTRVPTYTFKDCANYGTIRLVNAGTSMKAIGAGLVGTYQPNSLFTNCHNYGDVIASTKINSIGGICGKYNATPKDTTPTVFEHCTNSGKISSNEGYYIGGIIGYTTVYTTITDCHNSGDVDGQMYVAGISGAVTGSTGTLLIEGCSNTGDIVCSRNRSGGIVGYGNSAVLAVSQCWNAGNVTSTGTRGGVNTTDAAFSAFALGGIAGWANGSYTDCVNSGTITALSQVGGIAGTPVKAKTTVTNCYNTGTLVAPADTCGAIIGVNPGNATYWTTGNSISNCYYLEGCLPEGATARGAASLTLSALAGKSLGANWKVNDDYCFPIPVKLAELATANLFSAQVVPDLNEPLSKVMHNFHVGCPAGISWTADPASEITFEGTLATLSKTPFVGKVLLTARIGDLFKTIEIKVDNRDSGVDALAGDIVEEMWYTLDGVRCARPEVATGAVFVVVARHADGSISTSKITF